MIKDSKIRQYDHSLFYELLCVLSLLYSFTLVFPIAGCSEVLRLI